MRAVLHALLAVVCLAMQGLAETEQISPNLRVSYGAINQVHIGDSIAVYSGSNERTLLLTHARRDLVGAPTNDIIHAPEACQTELTQPEVFWEAFNQKRFHDYAQQSTKWPAESVPVTHWVNAGEVLELDGYRFSVSKTPGFTRDAHTYLCDIDGKQVMFTGDLIYGDGQLLDLYSVQDEIVEAKIGGYHGYGGRLGDLVRSLEKLIDLEPDLWVPARGPVIRNPKEAAEKLIGRVKALYKNYLSTNALHWYFKEERMRTAGERVLGAGAEIELMPYAQHVDVPEWVFQHATSRLIISDTGYGFLLDCGYQRVIDAVQKLIDQGVVKGLEGIFATHYHDDHTDMIQAASVHFDCPVYATPAYSEVLAHPDRFHLPALTDHAIQHIKVMPDGAEMNWREYDFTFHDFPGQTLYHGALLVKRPDQPPVFFIGDAFAPSGIDDYCVLNRNLLHEDSGYLVCLKKVREQGSDTWLVNQHIQHLFNFSERELDFLESRYRERIAILTDLFPWDDPNYGIDEQWAVLVPRGATLKPGESRTVELRITNHSPVARRFTVEPRGWRGLQVKALESVLQLESRAEGVIQVRVTAPINAGTTVLTAGIESEGMAFDHWADAVFTVE